MTRLVRYPFVAPLVPAILDGAKTETRRIIPADPTKRERAIARKARAGDTMIGCEALRIRHREIADWFASYAADNTSVFVDGRIVPWRWKVRVLTARYMPTECARIRKLVVGARVERVREIDDEAIQAEGVAHWDDGAGWVSAIDGAPYETLRELWAAGWDRLHPKPGERWADNPEVHVTRWGKDAR